MLFYSDDVINALKTCFFSRSSLTRRYIDFVLCGNLMNPRLRKEHANDLSLYNLFYLYILIRIVIYLYSLLL